MPLPSLEQPQDLISSELLARNQQVSIATSTFYPNWYPGQDGPITSDKIRGDLALETICAAGLRGYNMVVVDGGSNADFMAAARYLSSRYPGLSVEEQESNEPGLNPEDPGMSAGRRQALRLASEISGTKVVVWTEPEKAPLIRDCMDAPLGYLGRRC